MKSVNMKIARKNYFRLMKIFYLFAIVLLLIVFVNALTIEEERKLRTDGLIIKQETKIVDRVFIPQGNEGFVRIVDDSVFLIRNMKIETGEIIVESGKETHVIFKVGKYNYDNYIQVTGEGNFKKITINGEEFRVKSNKNNPPKFVLDENSKLASGTKFETGKYEYFLNGYKVNLPENAIVEYFEDRIRVTVPSGSEIVPSVDKDKVKGIFEVKTKEPGFLIISGEKFQTYDRGSSAFIEKEMSLFYSYENGKLRAYSKDEIGIFFNDKNEVDFSFMNPGFGEGKEMDLIFDVTDMTRTGVLLTKDNIGSISSQGKGPIINIMPGNRLNAGINKDGNNDLAPGKKTLSFQGIDGYAILERGEPGKISVLKINGNSIYGPDKKSFFMSSNQVYHNPSALIPGVNHGDTTIPIKISFVDNQGNSAFKWDVFSTNENGYVFVPPGKLESALEYHRGEKGTLVSNSLAFNQLSPRAKQIYTELIEQEQSALINSLSQGGIASLEAQLGEIELKRSPLRASVDLSSCSGTLVGYIGDKAYVLTAAHCVWGVGSGRTVYLNYFKDDIETRYSTLRYERGSGIRGRVVAYSSRGYSSSKYKDLALIELNPSQSQLSEIKKRGFVKIAPTNFNLNIGDKVTMIGCPGGSSNFYVRGCAITDISRTTGTDSLSVNKNPYGGQSGGGLFKGRYLIGVVQSGGGGWGGFANLKSIHKLLDDNGYSQLYKYLLVFLKDKYFLIVLLLLYDYKK